MNFDKSIDKVVDGVAKTQQKREKRPEKGIEYAEDLYKDTAKHFFFICEELPEGGEDLDNLAEGLATEILECMLEGMRLLSDGQKTSRKMGERVLEVMQNARGIAPDGSDIAERLDRTIDALEQQLAG